MYTWTKRAYFLKRIFLAHKNPIISQQIQAFYSDLLLDFCHIFWPHPIEDIHFRP